MRRLPGIAQEIADAIGRDATLYLIGQLPTCTVEHAGGRGAARSRRVIMYVPQRLKPDHRLVEILGWPLASKLVAAFGGEILCPPVMADAVYRPHRDDAIRRLAGQGVPRSLLAEWFGVDVRRINQIQREIPQEATPRAANDNLAPCRTRARARG